MFLPRQNFSITVEAAGGVTLLNAPHHTLCTFRNWSAHTPTLRVG